MALELFFAVTQNSFYLAALDSRGQPYLLKLEGKEDQGLPPGTRTAGDLLAVTSFGAFFYRQDYSPFSGPRPRPQRPEEVNISFWSGGTSAVVALFLDYSAALGCYRAPDLAPLDPRWRDATLETLAAIGHDHPKFIPGERGSLRIAYPD